jgi:hypothetical protein
MNSTRPARTAAIALLAILLVSCVLKYEVLVTNRLSVPVLIEIAQYHSPGFDGTTPRDFTDDLMVGTQQLMLGPGEQKILEFNSAAGGFWLRWRQLDPAPTVFIVSTLDLNHDKRTITID